MGGICLAIGLAILMIKLVTMSADSGTQSRAIEKSQSSVAPRKRDVATVPVSDNSLSPDHGKKAVSMEARRAELARSLDRILKEPDYKEQPSMLYDLMLRASQEDIRELLTMGAGNSEYSEGFKESIMAAAYERWYEIDPATAMRELDASSLSGSRKNTLAEVLLENWASRSPEGVLAFLQQGELVGVPSDTVYGSLVRGSAEKGDRTTVEHALQNIQDPKLHSYAVRAVARSFQEGHPALFDEWLGTLPPPEQAMAIGESAWILAGKKEIDGALGSLGRLEQMHAENLTVTRRKVAVEWARNEPARAADWMLTQNVSVEEREILFGNVLRVWLAKDNNGAVDWIENQIGSGKIDEDFMNRLAERL